MVKKPKKVAATTAPRRPLIEPIPPEELQQKKEKPTKPPKVKRIMTPERRQTIITRLALSLIAFVVLLGVFTVLNVLPDGRITNYEIRLFAILFLFMCGFLVLSVFMLRNAVVSNTSFLIRLKDSVFASGRTMKEVERSIMGNTDAQNRVAHATENLDRSIKVNAKKEES